jgi:DNA polymerase III delta prime subunit
MNKFFTVEHESPLQADRKPTVWWQKHCPTTLDEYVGNPHIKETVKKYIAINDIPHLLFYGSAGTGKTTLAKLITNNLNCDCLYINASDDNNVENVRTKIKDFAANIGFSPLKVVILDEADFLTTSAQAALRNVIDAYTLTTRFIFTCNYVEKIIEPLYSRCQIHEIVPMNKKEVAIQLKNILNKEQVKHTKEDLAYIVNTFYPDIRKVIEFASQSVTNGEIKIANNHSPITNAKNLILDILKNAELNNSTAFQQIRQIVADNSIRQFEDLYKLLFDKVDEYAPNNQTIAILIIAEYVYQSSMVANREIMFIACIAKLLKEIKTQTE